MNLNQITVMVRDVEQSIVFYQKIGLQLIVKSLPKYARFVCADGNTSFSLHQSDQPNGENSAWIYFETSNVDEEINRLINLGVVIDVMPVDQPWLWREARLKDPDNNQIIIYHAGENRLNPPWRIKDSV
ncbi:MAG: VOC family protein [Niabella sp.]|nr:VOC family protein [Niabella sp.]